MNGRNNGFTRYRSHAANMNYKLQLWDGNKWQKKSNSWTEWEQQHQRLYRQAVTLQTWSLKLKLKRQLLCVRHSIFPPRTHTNKSFFEGKFEWILLLTVGTIEPMHQNEGMHKENILFDIIVQIYAACDFIFIIIFLINSFVKYTQITLIHLFRNNRVAHQNLSVWTLCRFNLRYFNRWICIWVSQQVPVFVASFKFV